MSALSFQQRLAVAVVTASSCIGFGPRAFGQDSTQGLVPPATREVSNQPAAEMSLDAKEASALFEKLSTSCKAWEFLPPEAERMITKAFEGLELPSTNGALENAGFRREISPLKPLPHGRCSLSVTFTPLNNQSCTPELGAEHFEKTFLPLVKSLSKDLREAGFILSTNALPPDCGNGFVFRVFFNAPVSFLVQLPQARDLRLVDTEHRSKILEFGQATATNMATYGLTEVLVNKERAVTGLSQLRDFYLAANMPRCAAIAQGLVTDIETSPFHIRLSRDLGPVQDSELVQAPQVLRDAILRRRPMVERLSSREELKEIGARLEGHDLGETLRTILRFELAAKVAEADEVEIAATHLMEAGRFVKESAARAATKDPTEIAGFIREVFSNRYKNVYTSDTQLSGISNFVAVNLTDCSVRALTARECFAQAGIVSGIEIIGVRGESGELSGAFVGHAYNFVDTPQGRLYFDFSRPDSEGYVFRSNKEIMTRYCGDASKATVGLSTTDDGQIMSHLMYEPFVKDTVEFLKVFEKDKLPLKQLLKDHPEIIPHAQRLVVAFKAVDLVSGTSLAEKFVQGTAEDIATLFPSSVSKK